jgi:hypothetical protein
MAQPMWRRRGQRFDSTERVCEEESHTGANAFSGTAYNCLHVSKRIQLSEEAYERLAAHKRDDETFSEVVLRLAGSRVTSVPRSRSRGLPLVGHAGERSLVELAGVLDDEDATAVREAIDERRDRRSDELDAIADDFGQA